MANNNNAKIRIPLRRATTTEWENSDIILALGELGYEIDTGKFKVGDGGSDWANLPYVYTEGQTSLGGLGDVTINSVSDGQILSYDSANNIWKNTALTIPQSAIDDFYDYILFADNTFTGANEFSVLLPSGTVSTLGSSTQKWDSFYASNAYIDTLNVNTFSVDLESLSDVAITNVEDGQFLQYDETAGAWKNVTSEGVSVTFASISGNATDNLSLSAALDSKQNILSVVSPLSLTNNVLSLTGDFAVTNEDNTYSGVNTFNNYIYTSNILPSVASNKNIGASANKYNQIYTVKLNADNLVPGTVVSGTIGNIKTEGHIIPATTSENIDLGSSSYKYRNVYAKTFYTEQILPIPNTSVLNIGSSTSKITNLYATNIYADNVGASLSSLQDVQVSGVLDGEVLYWNAPGQYWSAKTISGGGNIDTSNFAKISTDNTYAVGVKNYFNGDLATGQTGNTAPNIGSTDNPFNIGYFQSLNAGAIYINNNLVATQSYVSNNYVKSTDIPTVGSGILTIQKNGSSAGTFSANASSNKTINITVPTKTSDLTNDSGFVTNSGIPSKTSQLTNDSGFITSSSIPTKTSQLTNNSGFITSSSVPTKTSQLTNDNGFITSSSVGTANLTIQKNGSSIDTFSANATANKTINITVPTKTSDLTNNSGFITSSSLSNYVPKSASHITIQANQDLVLTAGDDFRINTVGGNTARVAVSAGLGGGNIASKTGAFINGNPIAIYVSSDARLKRDIIDTKSCLEKINNLHIVDYNYKTDGKDYEQRTGVIAQEVIKDYPYAVYINSDEYFSVDYSNFVPYLIKAFQELTEKVEKQQKEIDTLNTLLKSVLNK